jgi:hypothetical protein
MKKLNKMNEQEKKHFLSMDLIERLIRLEQRVSASFGNFIPYSKTKYFKNLSKKEKKNFVEYLKRHKRRKYIIGLIFISSLAGAIIFHRILTARVIEGTFNGALFANPFLVFFLIFIVIVTISFLFKKRKEKRFKEHFEIIDKLYLRRVRK